MSAASLSEYSTSLVSLSTLSVSTQSQLSQMSASMASLSDRSASDSASLSVVSTSEASLSAFSVSASDSVVSLSVASASEGSAHESASTSASTSASASAATSASVSASQSANLSAYNSELASESMSAEDAARINNETADQGTTTPQTVTPLVSGGSGATLVTGSSADKKSSKGIKSVSAIKKIGLYRSPNFSKKTRIAWYTKQPRTKQPQFVVLGTAHSKNGTLRYKVRDVNHGSKTYGLVGYITANKKYVRNTYYQTLTTATKKKTKTITIINPKGVNAYKTASRKGKAVGHYRQGQVLKVKRIVHYRLTTRIQLTNGRYITANRQWIKTGRIGHVTHVRVNHAKGIVSLRLSTRTVSHHTVRTVTAAPRHFARTNWGYGTRYLLANVPAASQAAMRQSQTTTAPATANYLAVVATRKIALYSSPNFSNKTLIVQYDKLPVGQQPKFVIIGTAVASDGSLRYKVEDVNLGSKTYGLIGYITADQKAVRVYAARPVVLPNQGLREVAYRIDPSRAQINRLLAANDQPLSQQTSVAAQNGLDWTYAGSATILYRIVGDYLALG